MARHLTAGPPKLVIVDDVGDEREGTDGSDRERLALLAARAPGSSTAIVVTSRASLGLGHELVVRPLARRDLESLFPDRDQHAREALWLGSLGRPGVARRLAIQLDATTPVGASTTPEDPVVHLALHVESAVEFLEADPAVVALLEAALTRPVSRATRARLSARMARELLGDASQSTRRRELADEALRLAREDAEPAVLAEVLDRRMHAHSRVPGRAGCGAWPSWASSPSGPTISPRRRRSEVRCSRTANASS